MGVAVLCFPRRLCLFAILSASLGDPAAAMTGQLLGGPRLLGPKTWAGSAGGFMVCGTCAIALLGRTTASALSIEAHTWLFGFAGFAAALSELCGGLLPGCDDNLVLPVGSGFLLRALARFGTILPLGAQEALATLD